MEENSSFLIVQSGKLLWYRIVFLLQFQNTDTGQFYKSETLAKNLLLINPSIQIENEIIKFERDNIKEFFKDCDIVVEAFDKKEYKSLLVEELLPLRKKIVSASGIGGSETKNIKIRKFGKNLTVVGDFETDTDIYKTYSHKVGAVACMMAEKVLEIGGYFEK